MSYNIHNYVFISVQCTETGNHSIFVTMSNMLQHDWLTGSRHGLFLFLADNVGKDDVRGIQLF